MQNLGDLRRVSLMVDYLFGKGVSGALPKDGFRLYYSRRSARVKTIFLNGRLFATVKPNGAMALSVEGATILSKSPGFRQNCVQVSDDVSGFVEGGKSVFCKFVKWAGKNVYPKSEVAIIDGRGSVVGVGMAVMNGAAMAQFKSGAAVKVRAGLAK
ncbi:MAG TPA: PUA domain-containing protein [Nitrososphaerales archaeon]|nr:PUA domain-containing protein [Nitrososphaerales archaeon]